MEASDRITEGERTDGRLAMSLRLFLRILKNSSGWFLYKYGISVVDKLRNSYYHQ